MSIFLLSTSSKCYFCKGMVNMNYELQYIALLVASGSIKKLFSIYCVSIYPFSIFVVTPHCLFRDSLTLSRAVTEIM